MGLRLFSAMQEYIGSGCECNVKVIGSCFIDGFLFCGLGTPSIMLAMNAELQIRWTPSLEQHIKIKAAELGYPTDDHTGLKFEAPLAEVGAPCCV